MIDRPDYDARQRVERERENVRHDVGQNEGKPLTRWIKIAQASRPSLPTGSQNPLRGFSRSRPRLVACCSLRHSLP